MQGWNPGLPAGHGASLSGKLPTVVEVEQWLREQCAEYGWGLGGVFRSLGDHAWPLVATGPEDLEAQLLAGGHILPLPKEPAALANVLEVGIVSFLIDRAADLGGAVAARGTERGYPDVELSGAAFGDGFHAIDIKVARRAVGTRGNPLGQDAEPDHALHRQHLLPAPEDSVPGGHAALRRIRVPPRRPRDLHARRDQTPGGWPTWS